MREGVRECEVYGTLHIMLFVLTCSMTVSTENCLGPKHRGIVKATSVWVRHEHKLISQYFNCQNMLLFYSICICAFSLIKPKAPTIMVIYIRALEHKDIER